MITKRSHPPLPFLLLLVLSAFSASTQADPTPPRSLAMRSAEQEPVTLTISEVRHNPADRSLRVRAIGQAKWEGGVLFDDAVRDALRARSRSARDQADLASDVLVNFLVSYPLVVDAGLVMGLGRGDGSQVLKLALVDAGSYALSGGVAYLLKGGIGRERPYGRECDQDPEYSEKCAKRDRYRSFPSGHAALTFTAAGLVCAQHQELKIYGGMADAAACGAMLGGAATTGVLRIISDNHYATDVMAGAALGFVSGYVLPRLLYRSGWLGDSSSDRASDARDGLTPMWTIVSYGGAY
jgi:membrane-associated phospholipid phosphatase